MDYRELIFETARGDGMPEPLAVLMVTQAQFETGNFTSNVFKTCNNAYGYKAVGNAPRCTGSPEGDFYKRYTSVKDSVLEITAWIRRRQKEGVFPADLATITTPEYYAALLKKAGYYGAPEAQYAGGLSKYLQDFIVPASGAGMLLTAFLLLLWINRKKLT